MIGSRVYKGADAHQNKTYRINGIIANAHRLDIIGLLDKTCVNPKNGEEWLISYRGEGAIVPGPHQDEEYRQDLELGESDFPSPRRVAWLKEPVETARFVLNLRPVRSRRLRPAVYRPDDARPAWIPVQNQGRASNGTTQAAPPSVARPTRFCSVALNATLSGSCQGRPVPSALRVALLRARDGKLEQGLEVAGGALDLQPWLEPEQTYMLLVSADRHRSIGYLAYLQDGDVVLVDEDGEQRADIELRLEEEILLRKEDFARETEQAQPGRSYRFDNLWIDALPLGWIRNIDNLALLAPGVAPPPQSYAKVGPGLAPGLGTAGQFSVNGLRARDNNFTLDGADNNDEDVGVRRQGFLSSFPQSIDTISDFHIITALADTRYGRAIGGQVNAVSKFGSQGLHGSAYGFMSHSSLRSADAFDGIRPGGQTPITSGGVPVHFDLGGHPSPIMLDATGAGFQATPAPGRNAFTSSQTGVSLGGPTRALFRKTPFHRAGPVRTYFYLSYERLAERSSNEEHFATPTVSERGFSGCGGRGFKVPKDRSMLPDCSTGAIPSGYDSYLPTSTSGAAVFSLYPFPNNPIGPYGPNTFTNELNGDATSHISSIKLDRRIGSWSATGRYHFTSDTANLPSVDGAMFSSIHPQIQNQSAVGSLVGSLLGVSTSFRFAYGRTVGRFQPLPTPQLLQSDYLNKDPLGTGPRTTLPPFLLNAPLLLDVSDGVGPRYDAGSRSRSTTEYVTGVLGRVNIAGFSPVGLDTFHFPQRRRQSTFQFAENLTWAKRNQTIYAGFDIRQRHFRNSVQRNSRPELVFGGLDILISGVDASSEVGLPYRASPLDLVSAGAPMGVFQTMGQDRPTVGDPFLLQLRQTRLDLFYQHEIRFADRGLRLSFGVRPAFSKVPKPIRGDDRFARAFDAELFQEQIDIAKPVCEPQPKNYGQDALEGSESSRVKRCLAGFSDLEELIQPGVDRQFGGDRFDIDPRAGVVWNPQFASRWVLRGGVGVFSGGFPGIILNESRSVFPDFLALNVSEPVGRVSSNAFALDFFDYFDSERLPLGAVALPDNIPNMIALMLESPLESGPIITRTAPADRIKNPYAYQVTAAVDRTILDNYIVSAAYVGTLGRKLLRVVTPRGGFLNSSLESLSVPGFLGEFGFRTYFESRSSHPAGELGVLRFRHMDFEGTANSRYHSLQLELRRRYAKRLHFSSAATLSRSRDDASDFFDLLGSFVLPANSQDRDEVGPSSFDVRLRSVTRFVWDLPFERGGPFFKNWRLSGIYTLQTGQPYTVNSVFDLNKDGNLTDRPLDRPDLFVSSPNGDDRTILSLDGDPADVLPDVGDSDFSTPTVGRNSFRAPGIHNFDFALERTVSLTDTAKLRFRMEGYNAFNRNHFGIPVRLLEAPGFGRAVRTTVPPRTFQAAVKIVF